MIRRLITAAACAALAACGGGGSADVPDAQGLTRRAAETVLVVGDSTMTPVYPGERSTPDYVADLTGAAVTNLAVPGTVACQADVAAIRAAHADIVTANYALNDAVRAEGRQYEPCLRAIAAAAADAGSVLILVESNPVIEDSDPAGWHVMSEWGRQQLEAIKRRVAVDVGAMYCALPTRAWTYTDTPDRVHPTTRAKRFVAGAVATCIGKAL